MTHSTISFRIPGEPKPQGRPRFSRAMGRAYTPAKTRAAADTLTARVMALNLVDEPLADPLHVVARFGLPVPASWPKWKQEAALTGELLHASKPDIDNFVKMLFDACNGVLWVDDSQIFHIDARAEYTAFPSTLVFVTRWPQATKPEKTARK